MEHVLTRPWLTLRIGVGLVGLWPALAGFAADPVAVFLSDVPERIVVADQAWGELGFDTAAHAAGKPGEPLRIAGRQFAKGLGHHANGSIVVMLDGEFSAFDAAVGLQPCGGGGSVAFRVFVDGLPRYDSGVLLATNRAQLVHLPLDGAQELRLESSDAGDGITCDVANWADARLTRATNAAAVRAEPPVDVARSARVVTWDPRRGDGARASRIEEFRAEDVYLETEVRRAADGTFAVPVATNGLACIGLQWLNRRALRELSLQFAEAAQVPATNDVRIEGWFGESAWQGNWKPLRGELQGAGDRLVFRISPRGEQRGLLQIQKVRWIFKPIRVPAVARNLSAFTRSRWDTAEISIEAEHALPGASGRVWVHDGELVSAVPARWDLARPLVAKVRYGRPSSLKSDRTVLEFHLPTGAVGVAVDDILTNDCVYLPDHGLFIARQPPPFSLAGYKQRIAGRKTILQQVRERPDQTPEQAMAKTHHSAQREGPVMLSLACDNTKFVVERNGTVRSQPAPSTSGDWFANAGELRPRFGRGASTNLTRSLDGGWLPIPVIRVSDPDGVVYTERSFVAPCDPAGDNPARLNRRSVCVVEYAIRNTNSSATNVNLGLSFLAHSRSNRAALLTNGPRGFVVRDGSRSLALVDTNDCVPLEARVGGGTLTLAGALPAGAVAQVVVYLPGHEVKAPELALLPGPNRLRALTEEYWRTVLAPAMQIETPEPRLNEIIRSSRVRCLIAGRNEGGGRRIAPWIAAMSYGPLESEAHSVIRGMDFLGHEDFARRGLEFFIQRYNTNGFLTTGYTTFGTAWHLWTLGEHFRLTQDTNWLRRIAPEITRVGQWIVRQIAKTRRLDPYGERLPESGLMPPGVLADWNAFAYHFCMNGYSHAALCEIGAALGEISEPEGARFTQAAAELKANIQRAYEWTQARSPALALGNGTWIPHYPSQVHSPGKLDDFFPGQDAGRSWGYDVEIGAHQLVPTGVFPPFDREVTRILDHMEDVQFLESGWFDYPSATNHQDWFNLGGFSKIQPYYCRNAEIYAQRDDVKPFVRSYFNTLAAMLNPEVLTFWEHFHHSGAWDKTHETGFFLHQTRTMLVAERGEELWLAPLITSNWLKDGQVVAVTSAPTRFGKVSYRIQSRVAQGAIDATIDCPARRPPQAVVLRLRHPAAKPIRAVTVNGRPHTGFDPVGSTVRLSAATGRMVVRAEY